MTSKTFFLDQHGCAKNQVDGELIIHRLEKAGYIRIEEPASADLIIINSCGFIESAKKESLDSLMEARDAYPNAKILLAGCLAERYADVFKTELPEADGIFGNGDIALIDQTVESLFNNQRPVVKVEQKGVCCGDRDTLLSYSGSAFVKITEGCNNRCTFCAIPIIRGELRSRPVKDIVEEITSLVSKGIKEINLIGQDLAAYGCGETDDVFGDGLNGYTSIYTELRAPVFATEGFAEKHEKSYLCRLVEEISKIPGKFWVRLLYIHPDHFNDDVLQVMKTDERFLPYFDIPFQSGDDKIIRAMNRKGSFESYSALVKKIRDVFPQSCIRTTFLTGFPGEGNKEAENTRNFLKEIQSDWSGCFAYSLEDDTPAAKLKGRVPEKKAQARADELVEIQAEITRERLKNRVNMDYDILIEEIIQNNDGTDDGLAIGRAWFEAPDVDGNVVVRYDLSDENAVKNIVCGEFVKVHAITSSDVDIDGEYIGK